MVNSKCKSCESFKNGCAGMNSNFTGCIYYKKLEGLSVDLKKWTTEQLKNAIWDLNNGRVPMGGNCEINDYRVELISRGEDGTGYHEN